jgi:curved DNA-binding protein CbpA
LATVEKFHALKKAFDLLTDKNKREEYDKKRQAKLLAKKRKMEMNLEARKFKERMSNNLSICKNRFIIDTTSAKSITYYLMNE